MSKKLLQSDYFIHKTKFSRLTFETEKKNSSLSKGFQVAISLIKEKFYFLISKIFSYLIIKTD